MNKTLIKTFACATIFDAPTDDPEAAIAVAIEDIDWAAARFRESRDMLDATSLLDEIEGLRRFVLVRRTLARVLSRPPRRNAAPMGRQLCDMLHAMIGDVPSLVKACTGQGQCVMERDTRRAIACLHFLGSLDHRFI